MLRPLLMVSAVVALGAALCGPAMASEISGDISLSGSIDYTTSADGALNFFGGATPTPEFATATPQFAAASPGNSSAGTASLVGGFTDSGNITPAVFATTIGGQRGTLTLNTITGYNYNVPNGIEVFLSGTFGQAGYAQEAATASFLIDSEYMGNNVNVMMFQGIAQIMPSLTPPPVPEPRSVTLLGTGALALAGLGLMRRRLTVRDARGVDIA